MKRGFTTSRMLRRAGPVRAGFLAGGIAIACALAMPVMAQNDKMTPIAAPAQPNAIELGTGPLGGAGGD